MRRSSLAAHARGPPLSRALPGYLWSGCGIGFVVGLIPAGIRVGGPHMGRSERLEMSVAVFSLPSKATRERVAETHKDSDVVGRYAGGSDEWRWREALATAERCKTFFASANERPHDNTIRSFGRLGTVMSCGTRSYGPRRGCLGYDLAFAMAAFAHVWASRCIELLSESLEGRLSCCGRRPSPPLLPWEAPRSLREARERRLRQAQSGRVLVLIAQTAP